MIIITLIIMVIILLSSLLLSIQLLSLFIDPQEDPDYMAWGKEPRISRPRFSAAPQRTTHTAAFGMQVRDAGSRRIVAGRQAGRQAGLPQRGLRAGCNNARFGLRERGCETINPRLFASPPGSAIVGPAKYCGILFQR